MYYNRRRMNKTGTHTCFRIWTMRSHIHIILVYVRVVYWRRGWCDWGRGGLALCTNPGGLFPFKCSFLISFFYSCALQYALFVAFTYTQNIRCFFAVAKVPTGQSEVNGNVLCHSFHENSYMRADSWAYLIRREFAIGKGFIYSLSSVFHIRVCIKVLVRIRKGCSNAKHSHDSIIDLCVCVCVSVHWIWKFYSMKVCLRLFSFFSVWLIFMIDCECEREGLSRKFLIYGNGEMFVPRWHVYYLYPFMGRYGLFVCPCTKQLWLEYD